MFKVKYAWEIDPSSRCSSECQEGKAPEMSSFKTAERAFDDHMVGSLELARTGSKSKASESPNGTFREKWATGCAHGLPAA